MRSVIDTGVFFRPDVLETLRRSGEPLVLPAVALAERVRQLRRDGRDPATLLQVVAAIGMFVEPFGQLEAFATSPLPDERWRRDARDAMVAAHVREGDVLWTTNPRDFLAVGLKPSQVRGV